MQRVHWADDERANTLAQHYQAGDQAALEALHELLAPLLAATIRRAAARGLPAALQAADLQQESWLLLAELTRRWEPRPGISFAAYVARVFPWALARHLRAHAPERRSRLHAEYSWAHDRLVLALDRAPADCSATWDEQLYCRDLLANVEPRERAALWLHLVECRPFSEVARALGVPRATAFDLYRRGLTAARRAA